MSVDGWLSALPPLPVAVAALAGISLGVRAVSRLKWWTQSPLVRWGTRGVALGAVAATCARALDPAADPAFPQACTPALMMRVSMVWILGIRATHIVCEPEATPDRLYKTLLGDFLWYVCGISRPTAGAPMAWAEPRRWLRWASARAAALFLIAALKMLSAKLAHSLLLLWVAPDAPHTAAATVEAGFAAAGASGGAGAYALLAAQTAVLSVSVLGGTFFFDVLRGALPLVSGGHLDFPAFNNAPYLASSVGEFWARRYNLAVHTLLSNSVYRPLRRQGFSRALAALATFGVSGALHVHVVHAVFGEGHVGALAFFLVQALALQMQSQPPRPPPSQSAKLRAGDASSDATFAQHFRSYFTLSAAYDAGGNVSTLLFLGTTLPLYLGCMVRRDWFNETDPMPGLTPWLGPQALGSILGFDAGGVGAAKAEL